MQAKLFITGIQEPFLIDKDMAEKIQALKADDSKPAATPIVIESVWAGSKKDVRYIVFPQGNKETESHKSKVLPMEAYDAEQFAKLEHYYTLEAEAAGFSSSDWVKFYAQARKAVRLDIVNIDSYGIKKMLVETVLNIFEYPKIQEQVQSYYLYLSRKKFAEKKKLEELEKMAEQQGIS